MSLDEARSLCQTTNMGTREPDLSAAFQHVGYTTYLRQPIDWEDINTLCGEHFLVVMYQCHYSVIVRVDNDSVSLYDPDWDQVVRRARADFEPYWNDYEIDLDWTRRDYDRAAILVPRTQRVHAMQAEQMVFTGLR